MICYKKKSLFRKILFALHSYSKYQVSKGYEYDSDDCDKHYDLFNGKHNPKGCMKTNQNIAK